MKVLISPELKSIIEKPEKSVEILSRLWQKAKHSAKEKRQKQLTQQEAMKAKYSYD